MRIPTLCSACASERTFAGRAEEPGDWYIAELEEDNAYVGKCGRGHAIKFTLHNVRFEVLYESGIAAMLCGFHREAVSSVAAALERFYEFSIEVFAEQAGVPVSEFKETWKLLPESQRQFGAFVALYLAAYKKSFLATKEQRADSRNWTEFRNAVIHKGKLVSRKESLGFARYVFELIRDHRAELTRAYPSIVELIHARHAIRGHIAAEKKAEKELGPAVPTADGYYQGVTSSMWSMMLGPLSAAEPMDFESRLEDAKGNLGRWGITPMI